MTTAATDLAALCDELERHDREMTAAPWRSEREEDGGSACLVPNGEWSWLVVALSGGDVPNGDQNIDGIAYLRNNAARIASELRRLMRVEAALRFYSDPVQWSAHGDAIADGGGVARTALRGDP